MGDNIQPDPDYIDQIPRDEVISSRLATSRSRGRDVLFRGIGEGEGIGGTRFGNVPVNDPLYQLQEVVLKRVNTTKAGSKKQILIEEVLNDCFMKKELTTDVFAAAYHGMRREVIDPNIVLREAIRVCVAPKAFFKDSRQSYIQVAGLALRMGADPNVYIPFKLGDAVAYHVGYWVHRRNEEARTKVGYDSALYEEEQKNRVIALLILSGSDFNLPVTSIESGRESVVKTLLEKPRSRKSVIYNIIRDLENPPPELANDAFRNVIAGRLAVIDSTIKLRNRPEELPTVYPNIWSAGDVVQMLYILDYPDVANVIPFRLLGEELIGVLEVNANAIFRAYLKRIPDPLVLRNGDNWLRAATLALDPTSVKVLLERGAFPSYQLKDEILNRMRRVRLLLPLTIDILEEVLVLFTQFGYGLDGPQHRSLSSYAPSYDRRLLDKEKALPPWLAECRVPVHKPSTALRETAREAGVDPSLNKKGICEGLATIASVPTEEAVRVALTRQTKRIATMAESLPEAIENERAMTKTLPLTSRPERLPTPKNNTPVEEILPSRRPSRVPETTMGTRPTLRTATKMPTKQSTVVNEEQIVEESSRNEEILVDNIPEEEIDGRCSIGEDGSPVCTIKETISPPKSRIPSRSGNATIIPSKHSDIRTTSRRSKDVADESQRIGDIREERREEKSKERNVPSSTRPSVTTGVLDTPILEGRKSASKIPQGVCINADSLTSPPAEFSDLDLTIYSDAKEQTWCFQSDDYAALISAKINPFTDEGLPKSVLEEMEGKLKTLQREGVLVQPTPLPKGIAKLRTGGTLANIKSKQTIQEMKDLFIYYQLDPIFLTRIYTIQDMQAILDALYNPAPNLDPFNREHAVVSFSSMILNDANASPDRVARLNEIFDVIKAYPGPEAGVNPP
jgi:hypothetical protein